MVLLIICLSILMSAFFSGMEIAFVSANKLQIEIERNKDTFLAKILAKITKNPSRFITTMLIGNNIALVIYGYYMGEFLVQKMNFIGNEFFILIFQTFISTLIILVTAEFLPKAIFRIFANESLRFFSVFAYFFYIVFYLISEFIRVITDVILKVFFNSKEPVEQSEFSKEELGNYITEQLERNNEQVDSEIQIFQNALEFHNVKAREVMIPRTEIIAIDVHESIKKVKSLFIKSGLSKIIVYNNSLDEIIGYVNTFELFKKPKSIRSILLPVEFVPETILIKTLLENLSKKRKSIAIVLDEYGGTSGLITQEDIIEELFGEIEDEHDMINMTEEKINNREYLLSARLEIDFLNETYDLNFEKEESYETLGGYIVNHTESIPQLEEVIIINQFEFTITKVSQNKIEEIHLKINDLEE